MKPAADGVRTSPDNPAMINLRRNDDPTRRHHRPNEVAKARTSRIDGRCCANWRSAAPAPRSPPPPSAGPPRPADGDPHTRSAAANNTGTSPTILDARTRRPRLTDGPERVERRATRHRPQPHRSRPASAATATRDYANGVHGSTVDPSGFGVVAANLAPAAAATAPTTKALAISSTGAHVCSFRGRGRARRPAPTSPASCTSTATARCGSRCPRRRRQAPTAVRFVRLAGTPTAGAFHVDRSPACLRLP